MTSRLSRCLAGLLLAWALLLVLAPGAKGAGPEGLKLNLDILAIDQNSGSFALGQSHTWILRCGIPEGLAEGRGYVATHQLDPRLTLEEGILVSLHFPDGRQKPLRPRDHYQLEQSGGRIRLALTKAGMAYAREGTEIRISFRASINQKAAMGQSIPGTATVRFTDSSGLSYDAFSDKPEVHTGGLSLQLASPDLQPLAGGKFRLARLSQGKEGGQLLYIGGDPRLVEFVPFFDSKSLTGDPVTETTTGADGRAVAYGLAYGEYYLVQVQAPDGCNRLTTAIPVTVDGQSHLTQADRWEEGGEQVDRTILLTNSRFALPQTGGPGERILTLPGAVGAVVSAFLLLLGRRRGF